MVEASVLREASKLIKASRNPAVVIHHHPDGDAVGAASALIRSLDSMNRATLVCVSGIPSIFSWLLSNIYHRKLI